MIFHQNHPQRLNGNDFQKPDLKTGLLSCLQHFLKPRFVNIPSKIVILQTLSISTFLNE